MSLEYLKIMRYRIYLKRKRYELIKNFFYDIIINRKILQIGNINIKTGNNKNE